MMDKERFTMLLLEPGEIFFEDYSVQMRIKGTEDLTKSTWTDGRLKLCSKSLVFVDKDLNKPLIRIQFRETVSIEKVNSFDLSSRGNDVLSVRCKQYINMLEGNILAPYQFVHKNTCFLFSFNYAKVDTDCLPQIAQLLRAATLSMAEQNAMIMTIVHSKQSRVLFDRSWLEDLYEKIIVEVQANKVLPLIVNPGRILLTCSRLYFQPYNNMDQHPVLKINLTNVKKVIKRRFLLRQVGLEIQWTLQDDKSDYLFLSFKCPEDRNTLYDKLLSQPEIKLDMIPQNQMTIQWQNGSVSNYDYLLYVNSLADRTFHDLTQYPVMPWILRDYSSEKIDLSDPNVYRDLTKPIGAMEPNRLNRLKERYNEMSDPKFLYGSHYSAPGFVLFYLVRKYPRYMLCLQNGRFDHPDRMFNNVADVWKNVQSNMFDFKELIPEFYDTQNEGDFLVNKYCIDFGYRFDGTKVNDVQLPAWAKSPADFISTLRNALESDWVSQNLHHWIDLIFGYKQKGIEAEKANNVFFHLCYEGAVDLDTIKDPNDRHGLEVQIMEFGQIPKQVFTLPHPKRLNSTDLLCENVLSFQKLSTNDEFEHFNLTESASFSSHKDVISSLTFVNSDDNCESLISVGHDGTAKFYSLKTRKSTRSVNLSSVPLLSCVTYRCDNKNLLVVGSWDNTIIFYDIEFGKVTNILEGHEDAVSGVVFSTLHNLIISGSWDCTVKVWQIQDSSTNIKLRRSLYAQLDHECKVTSVNINRDETLLVSGTEEGEICLWDMKSYSLKFMVKGHTGKVNDAIFEIESNNIVSCGNDKVISVIDIQTSTQINLATLNDEPLCLVSNRSFLLIGDSKGFLNVWNFHTVTFVKKYHCHEGPLNAVITSNDDTKIVTGGSDKKVKIWDLVFT